MNIYQVKSLSLPQNKRINNVRALAFHPSMPYITFSTRKTIYTFCLRSGARIASLITESEITIVKYHPVSKMLIVAHRNGSIACYEMPIHPVSLFKLRNFHVPTSSSKDQFLSYMVCSKTRDGVVYTLQYKSLTVRTRDLYSGKRISEMSHKKIVTSLDLCTFNNNDYVVTGCIDGTVRLWENGQFMRIQFELMGEKVKGNNPVSALTCADERYLNLFSGNNSQNILACGTQSGTVSLWLVDVHSHLVFSIGKINLKRWITSLQFHHTLPILFALTDKGSMTPIWIGNVLGRRINGSNIPTLSIMNPCYIPVDDPDAIKSTSTTNSHKSNGATFNKYSMYCIPSVKFEIDPMSLNIAFFGRSFQLVPFSSMSNNYQNCGCDSFPLFSFEDVQCPLTSIPICHSYATKFNHFLAPAKENESIEYTFPFSKVYYLNTIDKLNVIFMMDSLPDKKSTDLQVLPAFSNRTIFSYPIRSTLSPSKQSSLIFYRVLQQEISGKMFTQSGEGKFAWRFVNIGDTECNFIMNGKDGVYLNELEYVILSNDGRKLFKYEKLQPKEELTIHPTPMHNTRKMFQFSNYRQQKAVCISRIFSCPNHDSVLLYVDEESSSMGFFSLVCNENRIQYNQELGNLQLGKAERVYQVSWQNDKFCTHEPDIPYLIGILTSHRILITTENLEVLSEIDITNMGDISACKTFSMSPNMSHGLSISRIPYTYYSILWVGNLLLFNDDQAVYALATGRTHLICVCTLDYKFSTLVAIMSDRLIFAAKTPTGEKVLSRYINMSDLLIQCVSGLASLSSNLGINNQKYRKLFLHSPSQIEGLYRTIAQRFNCSQLSEWDIKSLLITASGTLCNQILSTSTCEYRWQVQFKVLLSCLHFQEALQVLNSESQLKYIDASYIPSNSSFYTYYVELATISLEFGQYKLATECFHLIQDYWSLFSIFSELSLKIGLMYLAQISKENLNLYSIFVGCEVLLQGIDFQNSNNIPFDEVLGSLENTPFSEIEEKISISSQLQGSISLSDEHGQYNVDYLPFESSLNSWLGIEDLSLKLYSDSVDESAQGWGTQQSFDIQKADSNDNILDKEPIQHAAVADVSDSENAQASEKSSDNQPPDQDALRQKYLGGDASSSSNSDFSDSSGDDNDFKRRRNLFKSVRIADTSVIATDEAPVAPVKSFNFVKAVSKASVARRRRIGVTAETIDTSEEQIEQTSSIAPLPSDPLTDPLTATECVSKAREYLESKNFEKCIRFFSAAIAKLVSDPQEVLNKLTILRCIEYLLYVKIANESVNLVRSKAPQEEIASVAAGLTLASERMNLQHYFFCKNQCYKSNISAKNFAFAAIVIRSFIQKAPEKFKPQLQQILDSCVQENVNSNPNLPIRDDQKFLFDWLTLRPIPIGSKHVQCDYCNSVTVNGDGETCTYCRYGTLREQVESS